MFKPDKLKPLKNPPVTYKTPTLRLNQLANNSIQSS